MLSAGDIVLFDFPFADRVKRKYRSALVLSAHNRFGGVSLAQMTSNLSFKEDADSLPIEAMTWRQGFSIAPA